MKKLKINQNNSLKRVLSVDEMKSIFGGIGASITCTCTFYHDVIENGQVVEKPYPGDPDGPFNSETTCIQACKAGCTADKGKCKRSTAKYIYDSGNGSGSV